MPGITLIGDFAWHDGSAVWVLHCGISADVESTGPLHAVTQWYIHVKDTYPFGQIAFYPAKQGGTRLTFNHQNFNGAGSEDLALAMRTPLRRQQFAQFRPRFLRH